MSHGSIIFIIMWMVWCSRNDFIFNNHRESTHTCVAKIHSLLNASSDALLLPSVGLSLADNHRRVKWCRPAEGVVCLNVDGSLLGSVNTAGYGGLLRNKDGDFICGFYGVAAIPNILFAEIMAIWHGLELCWERGFRKVLCYSDSLLSVNLIKEGVTPHHRFANEIHRIKKLLARDWEVTISHTLREGNVCADVLAKLGASSDSVLVNISTPPSELVRPLWDDAWGVEFIRE
jgi:ribonuclease HI